MQTNGGSDALLVPEGTRLVHIGPHKTGTTSVQAALWTGREAMLAQGVRHVGRTRNPASAVRAVTGQPAATSQDAPPSMGHWRDLVREVAAASEPRLVVSSEFFSWAKPDVIRRVVDDLGPGRVHVVVTLRPLAKILPSQWQQNVQAGIVASYDRWLEGVFRQPPGRPNPNFWMLHHHDELIARWAEVVGTDHVTALVVDERDHDMVLRVFEQLLGLSPGTLATVRDLSNRSLTLGEVEAVRAFNVAFKHEGLTKALHAKTMRFGAAMHMKQRPPGADEARIQTPQWALERAVETGREIVANIATSGVRVVGDLDSLVADPGPGRTAGHDQDVTLPPEAAATMSMGVLLASGLAHTSGSLTHPEPAELNRVGTLQLGAVLFRRLRAAALRRIRRVRQRLSGGSERD
jgi:hypothetical protein